MLLLWLCYRRGLPAKGAPRESCQRTAARLWALGAGPTAAAVRLVAVVSAKEGAAGSGRGGRSAGAHHTAQVGWD